MLSAEVGGSSSPPARMRIGVVDEQTNSVPQDVYDRFDRLNAPSGRAGSVEYESCGSDSSHSPRQPTERVHQPHRLCQARGFTVYDLPSGLRCEIPGAEACAASGDDQTVEVLSHPPELSRHRPLTV